MEPFLQGVASLKLAGLDGAQLKTKNSFEQLQKHALVGRRPLKERGNWLMSLKHSLARRYYFL
jgi:hypothetical protein